MMCGNSRLGGKDDFRQKKNGSPSVTREKEGRMCVYAGVSVPVKDEDFQSNSFNFYSKVGGKFNC